MIEKCRKVITEPKELIRIVEGDEHD